MKYEFLKSLIQSDWEHVLIEVGAGDGATHSFTRQFLEDGWKGYLFEPEPSRFKELEKNTNGLKVVLYPKIVSNFAIDDCKLFLDPRYPPVANTILCDCAKSSNFICVESCTLKGELGWTMLENCSLLVIDAEGADWQVLDGMGACYPKIIVTEVFSKKPKEYKMKYELLQEKGYIFLTRLGWDDIYIHESFWNIVQPKHFHPYL